MIERIESNHQEQVKQERVRELQNRFFRIAQAVASSQKSPFQGEISTQLGRLGGKKMGISNEYNSPHQGSQLIMGLALSHDQRIEGLITGNVDAPFDVDGPMNDFLKKWGEVLKDLKFIDFGCGYSPTFAKTCRRLGALVYTVDIIPARAFDNYDLSVFGGQQNLEDVARFEEAQKFHIQMDLTDPMASAKILEITGGQFDLVTEAHLSSGGIHPRDLTGSDRAEFNFQLTPDFYQPLLKKGGCFFSPTDSRGMFVDTNMAEFKGNLALDVKVE